MAGRYNGDTRTTTQRGLGAAHQRRRKQMLPGALNTPCPGPLIGPRSSRCVGIMTHPRHMDLDEDPPRALGIPTTWRICCAPCNRSAGARLGNQLARRTRVIRRYVSRQW